MKQFLENIKLGLEEIVRHQWKFSLIVVYEVFSLWIWGKRLVPLDLFFSSTAAPLYSITEKIISVMIVVALAAGLLLLLIMLGKPIGRKALSCKFKSIGLKNFANEPPKLIARINDERKDHGKILELDNNGLSLAEFDNKIPQIEASLNIHVYGVECGKVFGKPNSGRTRLYAIPYKHYKPTSIKTTDDLLIREPNLIVVGNTGSGKSYALMTVLGQIVYKIPLVRITICDYKKSSFSQFEGAPNFYGYTDVPQGIRKFHEEYSARLEANNEQRNHKICVLVIDEYGALISSLDKKEAEEIKEKVANMLFMGRSLGMRVLIGVQRADAEHFKAGARDQFKAILGLGNLSKEQKQMLFFDYRDKLSEQNTAGQGYLLRDGHGIERVNIATMSDAEQKDIEERIRESMQY